jgi:hypothetical protein
MVDSTLDISDREASNLINKLIRFIGYNNLQKCLQRYNTSLRSSGQIYRDYYLKKRHPWWNTFIDFYQLERNGKSIRKNLTSELKILAGDAHKISTLQRFMPEAVKNKYRKNLIDDDRAFDYLFEIQMAWHFYMKGCEIKWHDEDKIRHSEFLVKTPQFEFNVECKRISVDIARKIRRRDFYRLAEKILPTIQDKGYSGSIDIKLNDRLHSNDSYLNELKMQVINQIKPHQLTGNFLIPDGSMCLDLKQAEGIVVDFLESFKGLSERKAHQAHGAIFATSRKGEPVDPIQMTIMSEKSDDVLDRIKERISKAKDQLDNSKPGLIICFLEGIDGHDLEILSTKSGLQIMTSLLLSKKELNHIVAISYCAELMIIKSAFDETYSNPELHFRNKNCKFENARDYQYFQ